MTTDEKPEMTAEEFQTLCNDVGLIEAIRTYQRLGLGRGDYTRDRHRWLGEEYAPENCEIDPLADTAVKNVSR